MTAQSRLMLTTILMLLALPAFAEEPSRPFVVLTGRDSAVKKAECARIVTDTEWETLWGRHIDQEQKIKDGRPLPAKPDIDFTRCMVVAIFGGSTVNTAGLEVVTSEDKGKEIVIGVDWLGYQSMGEGDKVTPFAFIVIPLSRKPIQLMSDTRDLQERSENAPRKWKDFHRINGIK